MLLCARRGCQHALKRHQIFAFRIALYSTRKGGFQKFEVPKPREKSELKAPPDPPQKQGGIPDKQSTPSSKGRDGDSNQGSRETKPDPEKEDRDPDDGDKWNHNTIFFVVATAAGCLIIFRFLRSRSVVNTSGELDWDSFRRLLSSREVHQVNVVNSRTAGVVLLGGRSYAMSLASPHAFERQLEMTQEELGIPPADHIPVTYERTHQGMILDAITSCIPPLFMFWLLKQSGGQISGMLNKKKFNWTAAKKVSTTFQDVAGLAEAKKEIWELVDFLKDPKKYEALGAHIPKGCLLTGPPGVGKTLLAKATAGEAKVPFLNISGSDFVEIFVGVGPSRVREMFKEARKKAPCIIFIDEIDAIGRSRRGGGRGRNDERESTLNALLVEMDGFNTSTGVVVLAGTNRPDVLDKALMRPGRFDRQIALEAPPLADRIEIWLVHLKPITTDPSTPKEELAKGLATLTAGFSGADIMNACNEAALAAAREGAESITMAHFEKALDRIVGGMEKKDKKLSQWERKVVAHHEAGHAIVGWFSEWVDPLLKVSIQPRASGALGFAQYLPKDRYIKTYRQLFEEMSMALGGQAAEKIIFNHLSSGSSDDLRRVTKMAYAQVMRYGMSSEVGHVSFPQYDEEDMVFTKFYSTKTERKIDDVVRKLVDEAYDRTEKLLLEKKRELLLVAEALLQKEVLKADDLVAILGERPYGMPDIYVAKKLKEAQEAAKGTAKATSPEASLPASTATAAPAS